MTKIICLNTCRGAKRNGIEQDLRRGQCLDAARDEGCKSPIVTERLAKTAVSLSFHEKYYNIPFLENALSELVYGDVWDLRIIPKNARTMYRGYVINLTEDFGDENDEILLAIIGRIIERVYLEEICTWTDGLKIADLAIPHKYSLWDGANIASGTVILLSSQGIQTVRDLILRTREELCQIPGMTTGEVVKIEKSLASRGLFLKNRINCFL